MIVPGVVVLGVTVVGVVVLGVTALGVVVLGELVEEFVVLAGADELVVFVVELVLLVFVTVVRPATEASSIHERLSVRKYPGAQARQTVITLLICVNYVHNLGMQPFAYKLVLT